MSSRCKRPHRVLQCRRSPGSKTCCGTSETTAGKCGASGSRLEEAGVWEHGTTPGDASTHAYSTPEGTTEYNTKEMSGVLQNTVLDPEPALRIYTPCFVLSPCVPNFVLVLMPSLRQSSRAAAPKLLRHLARESSSRFLRFCSALRPMLCMFRSRPLSCPPGPLFGPVSVPHTNAFPQGPVPQRASCVAGMSVSDSLPVHLPERSAI